MTFLDEEKPSLDELMHYGVRGMKWGVRSSGGRARGVLLDQNQRSTAILTRARENRAKGVLEKVDRTLAIGLSGGKKNYNQGLDHSLSLLAMQKKRLETGRLSAGDILRLIGTTSPVDLLISARDNKG